MKVLSMTVINITLVDKSEISFRLLKNDFVDEWLDYFKKNSKNNNSQFRKFMARVNYSKLRNKPHDEAINDIHTTVKAFNDELDIQLPISLDFIDRQILNQLHRFFTTMKYTSRTYDLNKPNLFYIHKDNRLRFEELLHDLNEAVHNAEQIYYPDNIRLKGFEEYTYSTLKFYRKELQQIKSQHLQYMSRNHSVLLGSNILGKSYFNCYYDYDDPTFFDVKNCEHYCCDLEFEFRDPNVFNLLNNNNYKQWLTNYKLPINDQTCGRMPIGDIINFNFTNSDKNSVVEKIEYA